MCKVERPLQLTVDKGTDFNEHRIGKEGTLGRKGHWAFDCFSVSGLGVIFHHSNVFA